MYTHFNAHVQLYMHAGTSEGVGAVCFPGMWQSHDLRHCSIRRKCEEAVAVNRNYITWPLSCLNLNYH